MPIALILILFFALFAVLVGLLWRITHALEKGAKDVREIARDIEKLSSGTEL